MTNLSPLERSRPNYDLEKCYTVSHTLPGSMIERLNTDSDARNLSRSYLIVAILAAYYAVPVPIVVPNNGKLKKAKLARVS